MEHKRDVTELKGVTFMYLNSWKKKREMRMVQKYYLKK